ncbi:MAG TPA: glycoside hydrolase family 2 TIM barrel-domain containing protein [Tepidisphaeraceae bacterium]|jgi:beta-galactosidase/beta-glucuronidase
MRSSLVFLVVISLARLVCAAVVPAEKEHVVSLDGTWRFKLEQNGEQDHGPGDQGNKKVAPNYPKTFEPFYQAEYQEKEGWNDIKVPGNWEIPGFSAATYNQPDNASGFYRHSFIIPANWKGRLVKLNFDGVQNGCEIWLNGKPVKVDEGSWGRENYHEGGWTAFQVDLTPAVKFGEQNLLALRVTKNTQSSDLDSGDYFFLGGVHRPVTLFAVPQTHLADVKVETKLLGENKAEVKLIATVEGGDAGSVSMNIEGVEGAADAKVENGKATVTKVVQDPKLWSAEFPNLYTMKVELKDPAGKTIEQASERIGIREVTIKDAVLLINGKPVKFAGICRHDVSPAEGTATPPAIWRKDIELMKAANINAIRTSHYPYGKGFYDLCDEMGMYVVDELPYCWTPTDDAAMEPAFTQRARETVRRDKNHPSVVIWAVGNENKEGRNLQVVADLVKQLDTTRPRAVSWFGAAKYKTELSDSHYTRPDPIEKSAIRAKSVGHPHIYLENPNDWEVRLAADPGAWVRWEPVLERCWDVVAKYDTLPGTFLWEWQDRAVADQAKKKLYYFFPETGINLLKIKGIVDGFRNPRPWYYDVKMIYAPIRFGEKLDTSGASASCNVENRYSFTDLGQLKATWKLISGGKAVGEGDVKLRGKPLSGGKASFELPNTVKQAEAVQIDINHPDGRHIIAHQYRLKEPAQDTQFDASLSANVPFPRFNLITRKTERDPGFWRKVTRYPVTLANVKTEGSSKDLAQMKKLTADVVGGAENAKVGSVEASFANNELKYRFTWSGAAKTEVQELGWAFELPREMDHFSWDRQARWTVYPETHIGRPSGTARPDSMNVPYTKMDRPDAFDFNSTKYDCNWGTMTDGSGDGLRVQFNEEKRLHCRGGVSDDKQHIVLFVNHQVSPPDDLSTNVVRDLYMTLNPGDTVEGSFRVGSVKKK